MTNDTETRLREALSARADTVTPSGDGYNQIAARLARRSRPGRRTAPWVRPMFAAGFVAVVVGVVAVAVMALRDDDPVISTADPDPTVPATTPDAPLTTPGGGAVTDPAAELEVVLAARFPDAPVEVVDDGGSLAILGASEGGVVERAVATATGDGAAVVSEGVVIGAPVAGDTVGPVVTLEGEGRGFEGTLDIAAVTPDGEVLAATFTSGGALADLRSFAATLTLPEGTAGPVYLIVSSSQGTEEVLPEMALVRVTVDPALAPREAVTAAVFGVAGDDVLNVRSGPDAGEPIVATLASTATDVVVVERPAGHTGWWRVRTPDGAEGWANSAFLQLRGVAVDDDELRALADRFSTALQAPLDEADLAALPWTTRRSTVLVGWPGDELFALDRDALVSGDPAIWVEPRRWPISPQFEPPYREVGLRELLGVLPVGHENRVVEIDQPFVYGLLDIDELATSPSVSVIDDAAGASAWQIVRLHLDLTTGSPEIWAVTIEPWDP